MTTARHATVGRMNIDGPKELGRAVVAAIVTLIVGLILKAMGAGKWFVAGASGAVGGIAAVAVVA
jgi:hypothetical protein